MLRPLILASSSSYRRAALSRLGLDFDCVEPELDEAAIVGEAPVDQAQRLALKKAQVVAKDHPAALIVGADQLAVLGSEVLGKPGTAAQARGQLALCSGKELEFLTAVALVCIDSDLALGHLDRTVVRFREISEAEIARYVAAEPSLDCVGSFKAEGLGICLFEAIETEDPSAIVGLPLIVLTRMLRAAGVEIP